MNLTETLLVTHVEDSPEISDRTKRLLHKESRVIDLVRVTTFAELKKRVSAGSCDVILSKYRMPRFDAFSILKWLRKTRSEVPLIILSSAMSGREAVSLFRAGAHDVIGEDELEMLPSAIRREMERAGNRRTRMETENILRNSRNILQTLIDTTDDTVCMLDPEGRVLAANRATARRFKLEPKELSGRNFMDLFPRADGVARMAALREAIESKSVVRRDFAWKNGVLDAVVNPVFDEKGEVTAAVLLSRDVTHLRRAEESLRASEERFRAFMDASPESLFLKDETGRYLAVNPEFERRHGLSGENAVGRRIAEVMAGTKANNAENQDREVLTAGETRYFVTDDFDAYGARLVERSVKFPLKDSDGAVVGLGGIAIDITPLKRAHEAVERTNRALRTLSTCNEALVRAEVEDDLLRNICQTIVETGGYPFAWVGFPENGKRRSLRPVAAYGAPDGFMDSFGASSPRHARGQRLADIALRTATPYVVHDGFRAKEHTACRDFAEANGYVAAIALPLLDGEKILGVLSIYSDVAEIFDDGEMELLGELAKDLSYGIAALREAAEHARVEKELIKLSRAVEQGPTIVIITDADGFIEYVNPKFVEITGYTEEEVIGKRPSVVKSGETEAAEYASLWATISSGGEWRGIFHNRRKDGTYYWADTTISPIKAPDGTITNFVGIQEDISLRLETEQRLNQAEKMESLGNLAGGIAHDFNNMLLPIQSLTQMTLRDLPQDSTAAIRLRKVLEASQRAGELVQRILTFSRAETTQRKPENIRHVIGDVLALLRSTIPSTVRIVERIDEAGSVVMDTAQIQTVILNLASNAADAMRGRPGTLKIELSRERLTKPLVTRNAVIETGEFAKITVQDTGTGIQREVLDRIFEPFFTTKDAGEGTGLGLAMVHGIVTQHGGAITVSSEPGKGTTFDVFLPITAVVRADGVDAGG